MGIYDPDGFDDEEICGDCSFGGHEKCGGAPEFPDTLQGEAARTAHNDQAWAHLRGGVANQTNVVIRLLDDGASPEKIMDRLMFDLFEPCDANKCGCVRSLPGWPNLDSVLMKQFVAIHEVMFTAIIELGVARHAGLTRNANDASGTPSVLDSARALFESLHHMEEDHDR